MSLSENPMTGEMRRSMANFVTTVYRGQNIIKKKVFMPRNVNSSAQQLQRASFKLIVKAYDSFGGITDQGFPGRPRIYSPYNVFMKANLDAAIDSASGTPVIDYSKLTVSEGSLPELVIGSATVGTTGITIPYETDIAVAKVSASDQLIAFAKTKKGSLLLARQVRGSEPLSTVLIPYPNISASDVECCYIFVLNQDGTKACNSKFVQLS
ncbi:MAG: DUF6266 family protein [Bacteroidota bacterium]|nr:DUF6266 family protein [Bacteroidota bacterium]